MTGPVYPRALQKEGLTAHSPIESRQEQINRAIFDELCQGVFLPSTTEMFVDSIRELGAAGADCVILGCTEIPLIISDSNSPLPVLDSTRLLATYAVREAMSARVPVSDGGWIAVGQSAEAGHCPTR
jgi:aspartate racemase